MPNSGIVYKLNCSCGQSHIGQTRRYLIMSIIDHKPHKKFNQDLDVAKPLILNSDRSIGFNSSEIIGHSNSNNNRKLRFKEALWRPYGIPTVDH